MNTYIVLANWTTKGFEEMKESPDHLERFKEMARAHGGRIVAFYMTMGPHDMAIIVEAPDDATIAKMAIKGGAGGATTTVTLKAFTEAEYREIAASLD
ncbi:GYD domain-containing protein [Bauldia sp.]|uniref:GYD domain-containing protein n=1 Tax=Bauldia sp. TaxID=2575872 RepID=UPI003BAB5C04